MQLYEHQKKALELTKGLQRIAYYIDMGGGKTFIGGEKMDDLGATVNLIVCQKSKINDWVEHFQTYYAYQPEFVYDLTKKKELKAFLQHCSKASDERTEKCYGVINYDLIFRRKELHNLENFTMMLDESSLIQNYKAKRTKFILKMKPANVILLSGTPTSGKYENLWTQIHLLGWDISLDLFQRQYINWTKIEAGGIQISVVDKENPYKNVERLKQKLRDHGAVFMKTEEFGIDLPEQTFIPVKVDASKEYERFHKNSFVTIQKDWLVENSSDPYDVGEYELAGDTSLTQMLYERQLCGQYSEEKWDALKDLIDGTNDRLVVFYNFDMELELMKRLAEDLERPISEVNGHNKDLTAYEDEDDSITLVQYQAGAMGLNLQKANKVIYFTLPLMSELFEQSKKRVHRIGQKNTCFYYILLCRNSVEERILKTLEERKDYTDELFKENVKEGSV